MELKLTDEQKMHCAIQYRDMSHGGQTTAERRTAELSDEFARLEVQIATILFAFSSLFITIFHDLGKTTLPTQGVLMMKLAFSFALATLVLSLVFGLIQIKRKEKFWSDILGQRIIRVSKWNDAVKCKCSFDEALAFHEGTALDRGIMTSSPSWAWILQTICLGISIAVLYVLALVYIFM